MLYAYKAGNFLKCFILGVNYKLLCFFILYLSEIWVWNREWRAEDCCITVSHCWWPEMASRRNVKYSRLAVDDGDEDSGHPRGRGYDTRFDYMPKSLDRVPWRSILLALFLLFLGSLLLFLSFFVLTGHMKGERPQAYGLLALGILTFLPGMLPQSVLNFPDFSHLILCTPLPWRKKINTKSSVVCCLGACWGELYLWCQGCKGMGNICWLIDWWEKAFCWHVIVGM